MKMGACRQAERKYRYFDRKPDLDNANVGTYFVYEDTPEGVSFLTDIAGDDKIIFFEKSTIFLVEKKQVF